MYTENYLQSMYKTHIKNIISGINLIRYNVTKSTTLKGKEKRGEERGGGHAFKSEKRFVFSIKYCTAREIFLFV